MKHYLLLKFNIGLSISESANTARELLGRLVGSVEGFLSVRVYENCIDREDNFDLMIEMDLAGKEALYAYLEHPYHVEFVRHMKNKVAKKISFDREAICK